MSQAPRYNGKDGCVTVIAHFADLLEGEGNAAAFVRMRRSELIGRPLGSAGFVAEIGKRFGRTLAPGMRGRKPRSRAAANQ